MSVALINIGDSHDGGRDGYRLDGDAIVCEDGRISWIGASNDVSPDQHQNVVDVGGATVIPGLVDSHVHTTFGDYTPRQAAVGYLESYVHGGTTTVISASEVHVPGRPVDREGLKALAIAAQRCFETFRPGGMRVLAGSVIIEPTLEPEDFARLFEIGVWLAKAGFGAFDSPLEYTPYVEAAKAAGMVVMCHTGGGSIPGSMAKIGVEALLSMRPQVSGHANGGPTALSREESEELVRSGPDIAIQVAQAGNLRAAIELCESLLAVDQLHRLLVATDTPTGTGVVPLGMLHLMAELCSVGPLTGRQAVSSATGNVAEVYGLESGRLKVGSPADIVVLDAPMGSSAPDALGALEIGDIPGIGCVVSDGVVRFTKSRNTPPPKRQVQTSH